MILCDTNIFIEAFKNNPSATETLKGIGFQNISLSAVTLMELYFGALNKRELAKIKRCHRFVRYDMGVYMKHSPQKRE
jgi:hypothetical protein